MCMICTTHVSPCTPRPPALEVVAAACIMQYVSAAVCHTSVKCWVCLCISARMCVLVMILSGGGACHPLPVQDACVVLVCLGVVVHRALYVHGGV